MPVFRGLTGSCINLQIGTSAIGGETTGIGQLSCQAGFKANVWQRHDDESCQYTSKLADGRHVESFDDSTDNDRPIHDIDL